jgi:hypothetical protein
MLREILPYKFGAHFFGRAKAHPKKPGFPLQVLGFAYANPVGFPLQSHCVRTAANTGLLNQNFNRKVK